MPVEILSDSQRAEWDRFPAEIDEPALVACFSFPDDELERLSERRGRYVRFSLAAQVGALRWLGFVPAQLAELPEPAAALIAEQLDIELARIDPARLEVDRHTRADQLEAAVTIGGFRAWEQERDAPALSAWTAERALGHEGPLALLRGAVGVLRDWKVLRPGLTVVERLVAAARESADEEVYRRVGSLIAGALRGRLDAAIEVPDGERIAPIKRYGQEVRSVGQMATSIDNLQALRALGAEEWSSPALVDT